MLLRSVLPSPLSPAAVLTPESDGEKALRILLKQPPLSSVQALIKEGNPGLAKLMIEESASFGKDAAPLSDEFVSANQSSLAAAVLAANPEKTKTHLSYLSNPVKALSEANQAALSNSFPDRYLKYSPLHWAAIKRQPDMLALLLEKLPAALKMPFDSTGRTPFHHAVFQDAACIEPFLNRLSLQALESTLARDNLSPFLSLAKNIAERPDPDQKLLNNMALLLNHASTQGKQWRHQALALKEAEKRGCQPLVDLFQQASLRT